MAGMAYHYSIDAETGVCLKYSMDVTAGGEKVGYEFLCTEFNTTDAELPEYVLEQTAPERVTNVTATTESGQVTISWTAGYSGGSPITGFEITMDDWATMVSKTASELSHTFTGLAGGANYTFKVRAINAIGTGPDTAKSVTLPA
jgi:predicted phage tail protein